ncbi:hypothetical protein CC86DRAFT_65998 [Ophiobolus disseminans]|uniref:AA1-like domain-containing protein n=1 Tax=Ophiobolus disseminans TaxID=1469910 RepID=A0A6A6ZQH9_9PLEO|nr:hypothetical protein CC86DRAFT_65998 [Ophiobolus disseminans]
MQFLTLASLFATTALAAPAPQPNPSSYENINIDDFSLRHNNGKIESISFSLSGDNATCLSCETCSTPEPNVNIGYGDKEISEYRFSLVEPVDLAGSVFNVTIVHQTAPFVGRFGEGAVPTYCRVGWNGQSDFV